ncbi:hypothetical protein [Nocardia asteroides]
MSDNATGTPAGSGKPEGAGKASTSLVLAVVIVVVIVIAGIASAIVLRDRNSAPAATSPTTSAVLPTAPRPSGTAGEFGTPEIDEFGRRVDVPVDPAGQPLPQTGAQRKPGDPDWLTGAPAGTRDKGGWQRVGAGEVVPFSTSDGPTRVVDGVASGYAHTPQGAALAAAYVVWRISAEPGNKALWEHALLTTPADMDRYSSERAAGRLPDTLPGDMARLLRAFDAFRVTSFAEDLAVVELAMRSEPDSSGSPRWATMRLPMHWDDTDQMWRLKPFFGKPPLIPVSSLAGWTTW